MSSTPWVRGPLRFLAAPQVEDPQERRNLRILFGIARPLVVGLVAMAVLFPLLQVSPQRVALLASLVSLVACLPVLVAMGLGHRGRARAGSLLLMTAGFASAATAFVLFGGLAGPLSGVLILTVMCAGVLSGVHAAVVMGAAAVVVASAQLALELTGLSFAIPAAISPTGAYVTTIVFLCVGAGVLGLYIHEMEQAAAAVRHSNQRALSSEQRLADLVRHSPDGMVVVGPDMRLESVNEAVEHMSGYAARELLGKRLDELPGVPSNDVAVRLRDGFQRSLGGGGNLAQMALKGRDGKPYEVEFHPRLFSRADGTSSLQVVVRDVTARAQAERTRQRMEEELRAARRMESLGRLAGGVAHDFRNLLTPVVMDASELLERAASDEDRRLLQEIRDAAERASRVTGQLLTFARKEKQELKALDVDEVAATLLPLLRRLARADVDVTLARSPGCVVLADRSQLEQVLVNLVANARDAMPHGGDIALRVERVTLDAVQAARFQGAQAASYVLLEVKDTGEGMPPEVMEHIWEPFFSTKPRDQGTGLGLATVQGIATQSGGFVDVASMPGAGSTFRMFLPAAAGVPTPWQDPPTTAELAAARGKVALVADDEALVRSVVVRVLRRAGYQVFEAANGAEALEVAMNAKAPIDLLVSDVVMPGMGGRELVPEVRRLFPALRVLLVSGYSDETLASGSLGENVHFLAKPFSPASLMAKVEEAMKAG